MAFDYINEAFKRLDLLEEQMFDTSLNGVNQLSDFLDSDDTDEIIRVIDPEAETEEEIQDSYIGKVIINCNVCHSHIFENKEEIVIDQDGAVNIETQCPYCGEQEGFTIVGEIAPYAEKQPAEETETTIEEPVSEEPSTDDDVEKQIEESTSMSRATQRLIKEEVVETPELSTDDKETEELTEDFKEVSITTDDQHMEMTSDENGKVTVVTEPVQAEATEDMIVPVSDETTEDILANNEVGEEPVEDELDFDFDELDETSFDELGEGYLRKVYENVNSFKTTSVATKDQTLIVEGVISFASGVEKKTGFMFEAKDVNSRGQLRFSGSNKHLTEATDAFSLIGRIDNKKLFVESLKYNYKVNEDSIRGIVRRK